MNILKCKTINGVTSHMIVFYLNGCVCFIFCYP